MAGRRKRYCIEITAWLRFRRGSQESQIGDRILKQLLARGRDVNCRKQKLSRGGWNLGSCL